MSWRQKGFFFIEESPLTLPSVTKVVRILQRNGDVSVCVVYTPYYGNNIGKIDAVKVFQIQAEETKDFKNVVHSQLYFFTFFNRTSEVVVDSYLTRIFPIRNEDEIPKSQKSPRKMSAKLKVINLFLFAQFSQPLKWRNPGGKMQLSKHTLSPQACGQEATLIGKQSLILSWLLKKPVILLMWMNLLSAIVTIIQLDVESLTDTCYRFVPFIWWLNVYYNMSESWMTSDEKAFW